MKKKPIEAKADRRVSRMRRPKAEKKRAKNLLATASINTPGRTTIAEPTQQSARRQASQQETGAPERAAPEEPLVVHHPPDVSPSAPSVAQMADTSSANSTTPMAADGADGMQPTSTLNLPPEVEEQVRIHGCENILRAFVAALGSLQNSVSALKSGLADAFDSHSANHSPKYERARYGSAVKAISTFLKEVEIVSYEKRFYRLALALDDLNRGTVDPLFEPIKTGGTKKHNVSWIWCARANVAVGVLALIKAGLTRKEAAQQAARDFPKIKELAGLSRQNPRPTATKILSWLDDFNKGDRSKIKNRQALVIFASGKRIIEGLPNEADRLRKTANQMFASALELMFRD